MHGKSACIDQTWICVPCLGLRVHLPPMCSFFKVLKATKIGTCLLRLKVDREGEDDGLKWYACNGL